MSAKKHIVVDARIRRSSTGRYVDRLLEHLQSVDTYHRYTILLQSDDDWRPRVSNFRTLPCPYAQFSFNPLQQFGFARLLYRLNPDLVHFTMTQQPLFYFGNIVTTTHDLTMFHFVRRGSTNPLVYWLKMKLYRLLFVWSHWKSDKIIVPTNYVAADLADYQPSVKNKIVVTYEASEPPLKTAAKKPVRLGAKDNFIMYVGNAFPHKNLPTLVDAFTLLHKTHPDLKLVLVGKKEINYQELEDSVRDHPLRNQIIFTGFAPDEELKWLYQHTRAYALPSLSEGFGLPGLEAMAHDAPLASSNTTCLPELYGSAAHYFNPHSARDMADKINDILTDKKLSQTLIKNGQSQIKKYSWHRMATETLMIYKEIIGDTTDV
ncbi:MAG TPA: glycosyltransferase family 1 protein [Candidatus Saccharimonadales bacterium]